MARSAVTRAAFVLLRRSPHLRLVALAVLTGVLDQATRLAARLGWTRRGIVESVTDPGLVLGLADAAPSSLVLVAAVAAVGVAGWVVARALARRVRAWLVAVVVGGVLSDLVTRLGTEGTDDVVARPWSVLDAGAVAVLVGLLALPAVLRLGARQLLPRRVVA